jgi:hypothetical protein
MFSKEDMSRSKLPSPVPERTTERFPVGWFPVLATVTVRGASGV